MPSSAPPTANGPPVLQYLAQCGDTSAYLVGGWRAAVTQQTLSAPTQSVTLSGLAPGARYTCNVSAAD